MSFTSFSSSYGYSNSKSLSESNIFSQTEFISQYIKSNSRQKKHDKAFALLQEFFGVFHDQMRINFDLRNELQQVKKQYKPENFAGFEETKENIDIFMKYFNKVRQMKLNNISEVAETIKEDVKLLTELREITNKTIDNKNSIDNFKKKIEDAEKELENIDGNTKDTLNKLKKQISHSNSACAKYKAEIKELEPANEILRQRVEEKECNKQKLLELLQSRTQIVIEAKKLHDEAQQKRRSVKNELKAELGKLTAEYHHLLYQEKPLIKALEEAENNLKNLQEDANKECNQIKQKIKVVNHKLTAVNNKLAAESLKKKKNQEEIVNTKRIVELSKYRRDFGLAELRNRREELEQTERQISKLLNGNETVEEKIKSVEKKKQENAEKIKLLQNRIEVLRKENQKISSLLRVTKESSDSFEKENSQITEQVNEVEIKVRNEKGQFKEERERRRIVRDTLRLFNLLKEGIRMEFADRALIVAEKAVDFVRETKERCEVCQNNIDDEPISMRVTNRCVSEDIDDIAASISELERKLQ